MKILRSALFQLFISRSAPLLEQYAGKLIQNAAVAAAAALAAHGFSVGDNLTMIASGLTGLFAVAVDFARAHYGAKD